MVFIISANIRKKSQSIIKLLWDLLFFKDFVTSACHKRHLSQAPAIHLKLPPARPYDRSNAGTKSLWQPRANASLQQGWR